MILPYISSMPSTVEWLAGIFEFAMQRRPAMLKNAELGVGLNTVLSGRALLRNLATKAGRLSCSPPREGFELHPSIR